MAKRDIRTKRAYQPPSQADGTRVLVDGIWPRGVAKDRAAIDYWAKDLAPSKELRQWFGHDRKRWDEFRRRYRSELAAKANELDELLSRSGSETMTLVFGARDQECNNAVVLREVLEERLAGSRRAD